MRNVSFLSGLCLWVFTLWVAPVVASGNADTIVQSGRWISLPAEASLTPSIPPRDQRLSVRPSPAGGGTLWYERQARLDAPTELVLDFASSSTLNRFQHWVYDAEGRLLMTLQGGLQDHRGYEYFLRHGRSLTLPAGQYQVLTRMDSPFFLALPEPHLFVRAEYERQIPFTQSLTLVGLGIFLALMFYYSVMAVWRRSRTDLLYALFIFGNLLYNGSVLLVYSHLFGWTWFYLISTPILFSNAVYIGFVMRLLRIRRAEHPLLFWLGVGCLAVLMAFWPMALFAPNWSLEFCRVGVAIFALYGLTCGIARSLQGNKVARLYLFANAAFAVPALLAISMESTSNPTFLVEHLGMVAVLIEVLLLAQVVSYQIGQVYKTRAKGEASLERVQLLDNLTAQAPGVIYQFEMSPEGRFRMPFVSRRVEQYLEITPTEASEDIQAVFDRVHPDDYNDLFASIIQSARHLSTWHTEFRVVLPIQGMHWLEGNAQPERLEDGTTRWYGFISDVTERKQMEEHMRHMAQHDPLTNLPNRALFADRLEQALRNAQRHRSQVALLYIDLDDFKIINDHYGHELGDELLRQASQAMTVNLRAADTVARMGGDEFVVLLDDITDLEEALTVAEKIRITCAAPFQVGEVPMHISTSIGIALYPQHASSEADLVRAADQAMDRAKQAGGNQIETAADQTTSG